MSHRYLLDINTVSEPMRPRPDPEVVRRIEIHAHEIALAAPVWHELVYGVRLLEPSKKRRAIESYLGEVVRASFPILPYDEEAAHWHAQERSRLKPSGYNPPFADGQIAAIAKVHELTLITGNLKDFERFSELRVASWFSG